MEKSQIISIPERYKERYDHNDLTELIETKDNVAILKWIQDEKLSLQSYDTEPNCTLMKQILNEAVNGDEIITEILDSFVTKTHVGSNESSNLYNIKVDFSGIMRESNDGKQESILNDLLHLWLSCKTTPWNKIFEPIKKVVEMCKPSKEKKKKKSSPQIILGNYFIFR